MSSSLGVHVARKSYEDNCLYFHLNISLFSEAFLTSTWKIHLKKIEILSLNFLCNSLFRAMNRMDYKSPDQTGQADFNGLLVYIWAVSNKNLFQNVLPAKSPISLCISINQSLPHEVSMAVPMKFLWKQIFPQRKQCLHLSYLTHTGRLTNTH